MRRDRLSSSRSARVVQRILPFAHRKGRAHSGGGKGLEGVRALPCTDIQPLQNAMCLLCLYHPSPQPLLLLPQPVQWSELLQQGDTKSRSPQTPRPSQRHSGGASKAFACRNPPCLLRAFLAHTFILNGLLEICWYFSSSDSPVFISIASKPLHEIFIYKYENMQKPSDL